MLYLNHNKRKEVITRPRTKGSKNRPKTNNDYASQIVEKQETIASLNTEIASIQKAIEEQKNTLKEKKTALKKAEKEVATLEAKKAKADARAAEEVAGKRDECGRDPRKTEINKNLRQKNAVWTK